MSVATGTQQAGERRRLVVGVVGVAVLFAVLLLGLTWAKWLPYADKAGGLTRAGGWPSPPIFDAASGGSRWAAAWRFTGAYFEAVWRALLVAVLVAAAVEALVPRRWLLAALRRRTRLGQSLVAGALSMPSMMCSCCTAPVAVSLRRRGSPMAASIAYWIGNPLLNPAVLVFLLLVLPWPYAVVRLLVGGVLVVGAATLVARAFEPEGTSTRESLVVPQQDAGDAESLGQLPARYLRSLLRFVVVLVPEYVAAVLLVGLVSGPLSRFDGLERQLGLVAVLLTAVLATALVIPTAGEIPVIAAVTAAGAGAGLSGVLLVALPAVSLPSMLMVGRAFGWRATGATAGLVVAGSLVSGGLLALLA